MAGDRTNAKSTPPKANWRGKSQSGKIVRHGWQQTAIKQSGTGSSRLRSGFRSVVWFFILLGLSFAFSYLMQFRPRQTPVVAFFATQYDQPFLPNDWAFEDLEAIRQLDGNTILLFDAEDTQLGRDAVLADFARLVKQAAAASATDQPLVVYLSMHADVNDNGAPCLVPTGASAFDSSTWIPIRQLLAKVDNARDVDSRPILFVIDCHRHRPNWHRGETRNRFVATLEEQVIGSEIPNLVVMTSCSTGEQSHSKVNDSQSAFGYFFSKGLSGDADATPSGNSDNYVSVEELSRYVSRHVDAYARQAFGTRQQIRTFAPMSDGPMSDFVVCWVATGGDSKSTPPESSASLLDLTPHWDRYESVRQSFPYYRKPILWGQIESLLIRTESLMAAGNAYKCSALTASNKVMELLHRLEDEGQTEEIRSEEVSLRKKLAALQDFREEKGFSEALELIPDTPLTRQSVEFQLARLIAASTGGSLWDRPEQVTEALQIRSMAESTIQGMSSEVTLWAAPFLDTADDTRLKAEDAMFLGQPAMHLFQKARREYQVAAERARSAQLAINIFNRATAEAFWYSRWASENDPYIESAASLIQKTRQLGRALHNSSPKSRRAATLPFGSVAEDVQSLLDEFHQRLSDEYTELLTENQATPESIHRAQSLLTVALLPKTSVDGETGAKQRERMFRHLAEQVSRRVDNSDLLSSGTDTKADFNGADPRYELLPLLFRPVTSSSDGPVREDRHQEIMIDFRSSMNSLEQKARIAVDNTEVDIDGYRNPLLQAAEQLRLAAAMGIPKGTIDVVAAGQRLDERLQKLDFCERAINDFYGTAFQDTEPYFSIAADGFLLDFQGSLAESIAVQNRLLEVNNLLNRRVKAASDGLHVFSRDVLLLDGQQLEPIEVAVAKSTSLQSDAFPKASGRLYFATAEGTALSDSIPVPLDGLPATDSLTARSDAYRVQLSLRSSQASPIPRHVFAVTNLRGNSFQQSVLVSSAAGEQTEQELQQSGDVSIAVDGTTTPASSVVVIFDCSQSMAESLEVEGPGGTQTRFEAAQNALFTLLQKLTKKPGIRVGLTFFGHRVGWNPRQPRQLLLQDGFLHGIPPELKPFEDVERLLPIGRFDSGVLQSIVPVIESTKPWGETPVFLSITEALSDLQEEDQLRPRRVIVITDGINRQVNPSLSKRRTVDNVLQALPENVRVDIVGFGIPDDDSQLARAEFESITEYSNGQFIPVNDVTELIHSLSGLVESQEFEVALASGEVALSKSGRAVKLKPSDLPQVVTVGMGTVRESIRVSGGENVQFNISDDKERLFVPRWLRGNPQFIPLGLGQPFAKSALECGIQRVLIRDQVASFEFSIQHPEGQFVPRPDSVQVLVHPADVDGNLIGIEYLADIESFRIGTPVPAFGFKAASWPPQATQAQVSISVQKHDVDPCDTIPLKALEPGDSIRSLQRSITGLNGVHAYLVADNQNSHTLTVVERHNSKSPGLDALVVRLDSRNLPKTKIRRIDSRNRVVATVFEFASSASMDLARDSIEFILSGELQGDSLQFMKPVVLPVSRNSGLLVPTIR